MNDIIYFAANLGPWRWPLILGLWGIALVLVIWMVRRRSQGRPIGGSRGFTLIEISIVLVIVGLMTTGALKLFQGLATSTRLSSSRNTLHVIENAIVVYAIQNGCLPCPSNGALASGAAGAGKPLNAGGAPYTGCVDASGCWAANTVVPWLALGLSESDASDAWNHRVSYAVAGNGYAAGGPDCTLIGLTPVTQNAGFMQRILGPDHCAPYGTLVVNSASGVQQTSAAVYVLISHGADGFGGWGGAGVQSGAGNNNPNQAANTSAVGPFVQDVTTTVDGATYFDDLVIWATGPNTVAKCGAGLCGNPS